jgi:hypothetical protein
MKDNGGCAFPNKEAVAAYDCRFIDHKGMTLRDYFAGQALVGILMNLATGPRREIAVADIAKEAYCCADGMLKRRNDADI